MRAVGIIFSNIHDDNVPELVQVRTLGSIPFGGRYRLIDFPLSNMVNSGIDTVGIITKSNYQSLMDHVGSGKDWDLARKDGGLIILPPFGNNESHTLYTSRLEALKGITNFLFRADEEYVVMSDCDSVSRINFNDVIEFHIRNRADITLVYKKFKASEDYARNSYNLSVGTDGRVHGVNVITGTEEGENNVFINVFVMKRTLLQNIVMDSISHNKSHFMSDVIASSLKAMNIYAYEHKGFYAGINSLQSYYNSNMALLDYKNRTELFGDRSVFTKIRDSAPTKYGNSAVVKNSMIADGCVIEGEVENSIIFRNVKVTRGCVVKNSVIMQNTVLGENCTINCIITDKNVTIKDRRVLSGSENHPFYISKGTMI
ncbi:MAG TPA: glucose-1-phosphate adenylyltransferase subunit GlgD [Clostridiales bacterium]|nr:glucose-1-phosphate adenylyltransferase subunit GlgD [Clostridiales bacterium]